MFDKFKGNWFYEIQILMFVIMWQHTDFPKLPNGEEFAPKVGFWFGRLHIWRDTFWKNHGLPKEIDFFWWSLTKNSDKFKRWPAKLNVIQINAKNMFIRWAICNLANFWDEKEN